MSTSDAMPPPPPTMPASTAASNMEPPRKKPRLLEESFASISTQTTKQDLETSLEVDHMILDYLTYQALNACFASRATLNAISDSAVESALLQVDEFFTLFKKRYPNFTFDAEMRFRQQLLQLVTLFTQRLTHNSTTPSKKSLQTLRSNNQDRARRWIGEATRVPTISYNIESFDKELPIENDMTEACRAHVLQSLGAPAEDDAYEDAFYGTSACAGLLELLPLFMKVSAACHDMFDSNIRGNWMTLAADWMLQACLEQYLVFGASGSDAIDEALAWGYKKGGGDEDTLRDEMDNKANSMFGDSDLGREVEGWQEAKEAMLDELFAVAGSKDLVTHLLKLAAAHPAKDMEQSVLGYLQDLSKVIPEPVLAQLEKGQLDGMSEEQTTNFMKDCGLNMADFFAIETVGGV